LTIPVLRLARFLKLRDMILVNSNPATIMTDPQMADKTYVEPITVEMVTKIIKKEKPEALLPTLGGQTALNVTVGLAEEGVLKRYNVEVLGANVSAIKTAEDREEFKKKMLNIGMDLPRSDRAYSLREALEIAKKIGFPIVIRSSFTLGGTGGSVAYNLDEFKELVQRGLDSSMISEVLLEESVLGWKEFELEVMRDKNDNVVIICSIENFDPMGIHTGDSITVAPCQTLTDKEYQRMRDSAIKIIRAIGVETGGSNIQFAVHPETGRQVVIEINPRVSRSSALASKATGFPIAKIAAKLAVGYTLDEIPNDITKKTPACFEPTLDYCVVKIPRFTFEKFPQADSSLSISMKSVGEVMAIGRTFKEALQKALRSLEIGLRGLDDLKRQPSEDELKKDLRIPNALRVLYIKYAIKKGYSIEEVYNLTKIDRWFLENIRQIIELEEKLKSVGRLRNLSTSLLLKAKEYGFSDLQLARILNVKEKEIRELRDGLGIKPVYKLVDTCAAEFEAYTPYYYSAYEPYRERMKGCP
jgi:carbamoyl-phosphate synthase large subunit